MTYHVMAFDIKFLHIPCCIQNPALMAISNESIDWLWEIHMSSENQPPNHPHPPVT